jgi:hypothetical protein
LIIWLTAQRASTTRNLQQQKSWELWGEGRRWYPDFSLRS